MNITENNRNIRNNLEMVNVLSYVDNMLASKNGRGQLKELDVEIWNDVKNAIAKAKGKILTVQVCDATKADQ